ncbi:homogentisate 1,2-dioxygenase [Saprolegnia parasitica CBS 223.65]|uniref:homogentisate 1,2-dioxygenase n=1 Tax=Saprolegnia parasitica (strain CBS 223.65) TaxID=695850 RepID=A0A067D521_SAPPC|nr:homogentisate 1,2-dioxygenase [Saprolegnia parasitica CBS 223.65]KDO33796.1 homogentisate 1,2-dioxygenase [Saprolegnia parasitica CBS 223.65]|eukprot:XP_012195432.1 homogentisate 1,2-dioxygenase [Saprolegnia parasitica CBS 223.65]
MTTPKPTPSTAADPWTTLSYQPGFGNHFASEVLEGALPAHQNNPQMCNYGLYCEQLSGTAFTLPRHSNQRTWLYRVLPPVIHGKYADLPSGDIVNDFANETLTPQQLRWQPMAMPTASEKVDFIQGWHTMAGAGEPTMKAGMAIHMYAANASMGDKCFYNSDGDLLIVPQEGALKITTEMGKLLVSPHEICVIQRGIRFNVELDGPARGYILEVYNRHFVLPDLGPIGANGLANPRDFEHPVAWYEDRDVHYTVVGKFGGKLFTAAMEHSPFDVVAWHGNYVPYKYNLDHYCTMNSVNYDHPDPSIYTVLTCQTDEPGCAVADFVIFPPRWMVQEKTFRPPYYHRNVMSEFMGMIYGHYDAKADGFVPGGASLHSIDSAHGPDATTFENASKADLQPHYFGGGLAFMFESSYMMKLTKYALTCDQNEQDYYKCWQPLKKHFNPLKKNP